MTKKVTEQVAREKERASLAMGHSKEKAAKYAQEVRDYAAKQQPEQVNGKVLDLELEGAK